MKRFHQFIITTVVSDGRLEDPNNLCSCVIRSSVHISLPATCSYPARSADPVRLYAGHLITGWIRRGTIFKPSSTVFFSAALISVRHPLGTGLLSPPFQRCSGVNVSKTRSRSAKWPSMTPFRARIVPAVRSLSRCLCQGRGDHLGSIRHESVSRSSFYGLNSFLECQLEGPRFTHASIRWINAATCLYLGCSGIRWSTCPRDAQEPKGVGL